MKKHVIWAGLALAATIGITARAHAAPVFADNFDDNDVTDWTFTTNYGGAAGTDTGGILGPYINAPPGGGDLIARASQQLTLLAGTYTLDLDALSVPCQGCTISYDILFGGNTLVRQASNGVWQHQTFALGALTAGAYTLTLGMHTTNASSGHFLAQFDNVVLDGTNLVTSPGPEPMSWALMILGFGGVGVELRRRRAGLPA